MTKETLKEFGLTDEQITQVWSSLTEHFVSKSKLHEISEENKQLKQALTERGEQLEKLKSESGITEKLKRQISELQAANQQKEKEHAAELKRLKREAIDERLLLEAKAINAIAVKPFLAEIDDGVDDEGYIALRTQHIEALTKSESTKFLFRVPEAEAQRFSGAKPGETGTAAPLMNAGNPFAKDTYNESEQIRLFRESPDLAKSLAKQAGLQVI